MSVYSLHSWWWQRGRWGLAAWSIPHTLPWSTSSARTRENGRGQELEWYDNSLSQVERKREQDVSCCSVPAAHRALPHTAAKQAGVQYCTAMLNPSPPPQKNKMTWLCVHQGSFLSPSEGGKPKFLKWTNYFNSKGCLGFLLDSFLLQVWLYTQSRKWGATSSTILQLWWKGIPCLGRRFWSTVRYHGRSDHDMLLYGVYILVTLICSIDLDRALLASRVPGVLEEPSPMIRKIP